MGELVPLRAGRAAEAVWRSLFGVERSETGVSSCCLFRKGLPLLRGVKILGDSMGSTANGTLRKPSSLLFDAPEPFDDRRRTSA